MMNKWINISISVVLVVGLAASLFLYFQESSSLKDAESKIVGLEGSVSNLEGSVSNLEGTVSTLEADLASANAQVSTLETNLASANVQVSTLETNLASANVQVSTLQSQLTSANAQVSTLETNLASANVQVSTLQSQLTSANVQVSSLQSQLASANAQVSSLQRIINLLESSTIASAVTINQANNTSTRIVTFTANYAGYIVVSGTSNTVNGYLLVTNSFSGYPYNDIHYTFGPSDSRMIPVLPGTVAVNFGNTNIINGATATITVVYFY
jgi:predicted  nucleic acid-binding Zn-ribbon protein